MSHEGLSKLLSGIEGKQIEVIEAYVFKFGALLFVKEPPKKATPNQPVVDDAPINAPDFSSGDLATMKAALGKHPNVFHLKNLDDEEQPEIYSSNKGMLINGSIFTMDINLPTARQKYQDMRGSENFKVIWNGSYFGAYATVQDTPVYTNIAHEFRELAREQIEKETKYKSPLFGPSPVWTDIIVAQVETGSLSDPPRAYSLEYEDDLYLLIEKDADIDSFMQRLFYQSRRYWYGFYELMLTRSTLLDLDIELYNRFSEASGTVQAMALIQNWKIWATSKLATRAGVEIGKIHQLVVESDRACWDYDNQRREYLSITQHLPHFSKLRQSTARFVRRDVRPPRPIGSALEFLEKQIEVARNIRSLVLASLLGAVTGALITGLLSLFKK